MSPKHVEDMHDAVIVGAGAAGLSAALGMLQRADAPDAGGRHRTERPGDIQTAAAAFAHRSSRKAALRPALATWRKTIGIGIYAY